MRRRAVLRHAVLLVLTALTGLTAGCAGSASKLRLPERVTPEAIARSVEANFARLNDLRARARIEVTTPEGSQKVSALIHYRKPDTVKIEVYGFLGIALWQAVTSGERLRAFIPRLNEAIEARAGTRVVESLTGVEMGLDDLVHILKGGGLDSAAVAGVSEFERRGRSYLIVARQPGHIRRFWVDAASLHVREAELYDPSGALLSRTLLSGYLRDGDVWVPSAITIERGDGRIVLALKEPQVNRGLTDADFTLALPEGARVIHLE